MRGKKEKYALDGGHTTVFHTKRKGNSKINELEKEKIKSENLGVTSFAILKNRDAEPKKRPNRRGGEKKKEEGDVMSTLKEKAH